MNLRDDCPLVHPPSNCPEYLRCYKAGCDYNKTCNVWEYIPEPPKSELQKSIERTQVAMTISMIFIIIGVVLITLR